MAQFYPTEYELLCVATGDTFEDSGWSLDYPFCRVPSLIRAKYAKKRLTLHNDCGLFKYRDWLPVRRDLRCDSQQATYKSEKLARVLRLENLYITFNGYFPERGATMTACTFKECEAYSVCARISPDEKRVLVVASAGNTARAFAKVCSDNNLPLLLVVPKENLDALWGDAPLGDCVKIIAREGDYYDAIQLSNIALKSPMFYAEGGAKNIARRDGMGTNVLSAVTTIGRIPDYYFQAVGSGTGAIAAWEANMRLVEDGRFGNNTMRLMVAQNAPFLPIYNAWRNHSRKLLPYNADSARRDALAIDAKVLSNRQPPYSIAGGLYDALRATNGEVLQATNSQTRQAAQLFLETEGIDIHPAAAVSLATLVSEVKKGHIERDATIMLNVTGGGEARYKRERQIFHYKPSFTFSLMSKECDVIAKIEELFA